MKWEKAAYIVPVRRWLGRLRIVVASSDFDYYYEKQ
jgi:hypothetical protein